jgi:hypothetical protein
VWYLLTNNPGHEAPLGLHYNQLHFEESSNLQREGYMQLLVTGMSGSIWAIWASTNNLQREGYMQLLVTGMSGSIWAIWASTPIDLLI